MTNPLSTPAASNVGLLLARVSLGAYLALLGYEQVSRGVSNFAAAHKRAMAAWLDPNYAEVFLTMYPVIHVAAGVMLALGVLTRVSAFLLSATLLIFMLCVQGLTRGNGPGPFDPNWIFLAVGIALLTNGGGQFTLPALLGKKPAPPPTAKAAAPAPAK